MQKGVKKVLEEIQKVAYNSKCLNWCEKRI